jgi:hypothetical protein
MAPQSKGGEELKKKIQTTERTLQKLVLEHFKKKIVCCFVAIRIQ